MIIPALILLLLQGGDRQPSAQPSADGRRQVEAVRAETPIRLDGALDEPAWRTAAPATDFIQAEPREGQPATERTEVRLAYDEDALYIGVTCTDGKAGAAVVNDIRKDFTSGDQDSIEILLDTFADRRNGFVFVTNPEAAKSDAQIANEGREVNTAWDAVWTVATERTGEGWTAEIRIPFKTLRFHTGDGKPWGINFARRIRRNNEIDYWSPVPRAYTIYRASSDGNLIGLPGLAQGRNLRIKPYVVAGTTRATGGASFDGTRDVGVDVKYGVTPSLTLDLTANPDFAQVEADEQQVNLTQFSLFYPEKREFFLENSGTFYFGDIPRNLRQPSRFRPPEEDLLLFFSRRIGLDAAGRQIPIRGGGRLTGRIGEFGVGAMTIQTDRSGATPSTNYSVLRVRRDILGHSDVGAIVMSRAAGSGDTNRVYGADANFQFHRFLSWNSFLVKSDTPGATRGQLAWKTSLAWEANDLHTGYSILDVDDDFRSDIGFVRRTGIIKHFIDGGYRMRPAWLREHRFRELHPHLRINRYFDTSNHLATRNDHYGASLYFERGGFVEYAVNPKFERIGSPFTVRPGVSIPSGDYTWNEYQLTVELDRSRMISGSASITNGGFWDGTQRSERAALVVRPSYRLLLDLGLQRNDISLRTPLRDFSTTLATLRTSYSFSTRMFVDSLLQYNTDLNQFNANVRFNLIHHPLSDFFVVYNEQQITTDPHVPPGRSVTVKFTHMLSF